VPGTLGGMGNGDQRLEVTKAADERDQDPHRQQCMDVA
jgi:hypothetical protein